MRNKQLKNFSVAFFVSFAIHLFVLTILFTAPGAEEQSGYKKIRVKVGMRNKPIVDSVAMAKQYAKYNPSAGSAKQNPTSANDKRDLAGIASSHKEPKLPKISQQKNNEDKDVAADSETSQDKTENAEFIEQKSQVKHTQTVPADSKKTEMPSAGANKTDELVDNSGAILGNSVDKNTDKIASYEQMLSLWLDKFKRYPSDAKESDIIISGEVFIKIDRNGKVLLSKIIKSTGYPQYDKALMKMLVDADPVLPVPIDYHSDKKTFSYKIEFEF